MKILGQLLLWFGFLSGSLAAVIHAPPAGVQYVLKQAAEDKLPADAPDVSAVTVPQDGWHLIPWAWFAGSALVCVIGVVMIRTSRRAAQMDLNQHQTNVEELLEALQEASRATERLATQTEELPPSGITAVIDDVIADPLRRFAEGRDRISAEFNLDTFADVMSPFAAGERSINRAWSAAADGYVDEAATCLKRGQRLLQDAYQVLQAARQQNQA